MSVEIDTSSFDVEIESEEYLAEQSTELDANQETEGEWSDLEKDLQPELESESSDPPPPAIIAVPEDDDDDSDDFKSKIWNAEMRCRGKEAIVEDLKEQLKFAKADYEDSVAALRKLATWGRDPVIKQASPEVAEHEEQVEQSEETLAVDETPNEDWKSHSLIEMLKSAGIAGMGEKKLDSLADICQTFGDFEDLRTKASLEGVHLKEVLPTGFGEKITDQIEEAYFAAIKRMSSKVSAPEREYKSDEPSTEVWEDVEDGKTTLVTVDIDRSGTEGCLVGEDVPAIIESVCESIPTMTTSKTIDLDDL